jgi:hypothetical protein
MIETTSQRKTGGRPWWEARRCELCDTKIGKVRSWEEPPRLVSQQGHAVLVRAVTRTELLALLLTHPPVLRGLLEQPLGETLALSRTPHPASRATG